MVFMQLGNLEKKHSTLHSTLHSFLNFLKTWTHPSYSCNFEHLLKIEECMFSQFALELYTSTYMYLWIVLHVIELINTDCASSKTLRVDNVVVNTTLQKAAIHALS